MSFARSRFQGSSSLNANLIQIETAPDGQASLGGDDPEKSGPEENEGSTNQGSTPGPPGDQNQTVPDGGTSVSLLGLGFLGVVFLRRKLG